ncbi:MAG: RdgB/HAM1 family non-canonical purine NTP pyrophosphatase [Bacteroidetes bacterium]|nr:RdgB/HAM1 family non-canonical purine NTP pyrophosphatase [Bacteroidota bacterium]MBU1718896.1 RdgB/HAM1 family non-canonical purine NTP pyrophosphatase [Bacteroidota bacterium]
MKLVFATNNNHKLVEAHGIITNVVIVGLAEAGFHGEIPENAATLEGNASEKAWFIYRNIGVNCFADDTGLEVESLNGAPGVYSARYAGPGCTFDDNVTKLLEALDGKSNRKARFRTVVSMILDGYEYLFEGIVNGEITLQRAGREGFGYDPVFMPNGYSETFAEMNADIKNAISHRGNALRKLMKFLD